MLRVIIIDDEPSATATMEAMLSQDFAGDVQIVALCSSAESGYHAIVSHDPDLVFLDINLPDGTGFDLLARIGTINFSLVFITAYSDYALRAFKVNALDYLMKPILPDELRVAVDRAKLINKSTVRIESDQLLEQLSLADFTLVLPTIDGMLFVDVRELAYCEAENNYTHLYLENQSNRLTVAKTLKAIEDQLVRFDFIRVHRSFLVNIKKIIKYNRMTSKITLKSGITIPISRHKKGEFEDKFRLPLK